MVEVLVGLGGNLGDVPATLDRAVDAFCDGKTVRLVARSSKYRTPAWGVTDQPAFVNLCIAVATELAPGALLERALSVEDALGRQRSAERVWGPRTIDLDILTYGELVLSEPWLTLPHPRMLERAFVLVPLSEIRPDLIVAGVPIREALKGLDTSGIERLDEASMARGNGA